MLQARATPKARARAALAFCLLGGPVWVGRTRRKPPSGVRPSRWRLCVRALAKQCFANKPPSPMGARWRLARVRCPAHTARPGLGVLPNPPEACLGPMRLTPPQPDPPRLRQISAICGRSTPGVDESLSDNEIDWGQIRFPKENGSDPRTPCRSRISPTVTGKLSKAGRCRIAGCPRHGCRGQAPMDGFTASPQSDTAPPNPQETRAVFGFGFRCCRPAAGTTPQMQGTALPPPTPAHENEFTDFSKPSSLRHASTILRSSMRPRATRAKNRPPIA
jgi:hypothetical protein